MPTSTTLSVPDMSCGHCKASVEAALAPLGAKVEVDLTNRKVHVEGPAAASVIKVLAEIGFPAAVVA